MVKMIGEVPQIVDPQEPADTLIVFSRDQVHEYFPGKEEHWHKSMLETVARLMQTEEAAEAGVLQAQNDNYALSVSLRNALSSNPMDEYSGIKDVSVDTAAAHSLAIADDFIKEFDAHHEVKGGEQ